MSMKYNGGPMKAPCSTHRVTTQIMLSSINSISTEYLGFLLPNYLLLIDKGNV